MSLKTLAFVSGAYDLLLALPMLFAAPLMARLFGAAGDPAARRGYFWVAGVLAKGLGALLFVLDHFTQGSPSAFLLFAATDGSLCLLTLALLARPRQSEPSVRSEEH